MGITITDGGYLIGDINTLRFVPWDSVQYVQSPMFIFWECEFPVCRIILYQSFLPVFSYRSDSELCDVRSRDDAAIKKSVLRWFRRAGNAIERNRIGSDLISVSIIK